MADKNAGDYGKLRKSEPETTEDMAKWRDSIANRDRVYAVSYRLAVDNGRSPEEARALARESFLKSFEKHPEMMFVVELEKKLPSD
ncbi:MAG: hypothetical protein Q7O66_22915 [Dehalococcoidia bacterium]|nr:hypothetical protein [Dehalococcoidia bacterium]